MSQINVGIIGFGTVGAGTFEVLTTNREIITNRVGAEVVVKRIADIDIESDRRIPVKPAAETLTVDAMDLINDPEIDLIVELMGGLDRLRNSFSRPWKTGSMLLRQIRPC